MVDSLISAAVLAALYLHPAAAPPAAPAAGTRLVVPSIEASAGTVGPPARSVAAQQPSPARDSLKNGAIIGAVAGAIAGSLLAAVGCAAGDLWGGERESSCVGGTLILAGLGAGVGALIGTGVDAMFQRGPAPGLPAGSRRIGVRLRFAF